MFARLREIDLNGIHRDEMLRADRLHAHHPEFDFKPPDDLAAKRPALTTLKPFSDVTARSASNLAFRKGPMPCNWVPSESFPKPKPGLETFSSTAVAHSPGKPMPFAADTWFDDLGFRSARAATAIAADDLAAVTLFKQALPDHASHGSALDQLGLLRGGNGAVVFTPDLGAAGYATTASTLDDLMAKDELRLDPEQAELVETRLDGLFETCGDSCFVLSGRRGLHDPRALDLGRRAVMANALLRDDRGA